MISENNKYRKSVSHKISGEYLDVALTPENFDFLDSKGFSCALGKCALKKILDVYYLGIWWQAIKIYSIDIFSIEYIDVQGITLKDKKTKELQRLNFADCILTN